MYHVVTVLYTEAKATHLSH